MHGSVTGEDLFGSSQPRSLRFTARLRHGVTSQQAQGSLARANARHREIAIRLSIGASRGRVVRQLIKEGLLIAAIRLGNVSVIDPGAFAISLMLITAAVALASYRPAHIAPRIDPWLASSG